MSKIATLILINLFIYGCAAPKRINDLEPVQNSHVYKKQVLTAVGYANVSSQLSDNPSQKRLMAIRASKLDAYRNLTEQVYGENVNSSTTVEDMVVANDTIRAHVEGIIFGARLVSITPIGDDSYETKLELAEDVISQLRRKYHDT